MATAKDIAQWMFDHFETQKYLYQESVVYKVKNQFGPDFVYKNKNGNLAIEKDVLEEFRKISEGKVVWERGYRAWRTLRSNENYKGRQVE